MECPNTITLQGSTCLLIDGMALVGKPTDPQTFGDYPYSFQDAVLRAGVHFQQIHVLFDRYDDNFIKAGTRERRSRKTRPIRRDIENEDLPSRKIGQTS